MHDAQHQKADTAHQKTRPPGQHVAGAGQDDRHGGAEKAGEHAAHHRVDKDSLRPPQPHLPRRPAQKTRIGEREIRPAGGGEMRDQQTQHGKAAQRVQNPNSISHWHTSINAFTFFEGFCKAGASA